MSAGGERYCQAMLMLRYVAGRPDIAAEITQMRQLLHAQCTTQVLGIIDQNWTNKSIEERCDVLGQLEDVSTWCALRAAMRQLPQVQSGQIEDALFPELLSAAEYSPEVWRAERARVIGNRGMPPRELIETLLDESEMGDPAAHRALLNKQKKRLMGFGMVNFVYEKGNGGLACNGLAKLDSNIRSKMGRAQVQPDGSLSDEPDAQDLQYIKSLEPQCAESLSHPLWIALFGDTISTEEKSQIAPESLLNALCTIRTHGLLKLAMLLVGCLHVQAAVAVGACAKCGVQRDTALSSCARCKTVQYCSRDCQVNHVLE